MPTFQVVTSGWQFPSLNHAFPSDPQAEKERVVHLIGPTKQDDVTSGSNVPRIWETDELVDYIDKTSVLRKFKILP